MIGVFDSGFGGLSVLKNLIKHCGENDYIYFGDNARMPYGNKSPELIYEYTREAVNFLFKQNCHLVILACNTASALALRRLQRDYLPANYPDRRILGVVRPIAEEAANNSASKTIAVIGTNATILSGVYGIEIKKINSKKIVIEKSTPLLAPLAEEGNVKDEAVNIILDDYLHFLFDKKVDQLILGCTHYPLLIKKIRMKIPQGCILKDPGEIVARSLKDYLLRHPEFKVKPRKKGVIRKFYTSDDPEIFKAKGERFLGQEMKVVEKINLKEYDNS